MILVKIIQSLKMLARPFIKPLLHRYKCYLFSKKHFSRSLANGRIELPLEIQKMTSCHLILGHTNYLIASGGTEKFIVEQIELLLSSHINNLFIYPVGEPSRLMRDRPTSYGVILNGFQFCEISSSQLPAFLSQVQPKVNELLLHHLLFWPLTEVLQITEMFHKQKISIQIYLHDFYFKCPKVNLFCLSGDAKCRVTYSANLVRQWRERYDQILGLADKILTPSEYMRKQVPPKRHSHVYMAKAEGNSAQNSRKLKLCFLGHASEIKGYKTWQSLSRNALITRMYELIHIGSGAQSSLEIPVVEYSYKHTRSAVASELLLKYEVDYVLLWSQVPESYSFTFEEARRANKFVITDAKSGNIAASLANKTSEGLVLQSEFELVQFLLRQPL